MRYGITIIFILLTIASCAKKQTVAPLDAEDEFERATGYYENEEFMNAIEAFERILFFHPTSEYVDDAQYWLGRSYFSQKDYDQAIIEFDYLIKNFTNSRFIEEAYFYRANAHFNMAPGYEKDPTELKNAINMFNLFLTRFPNSEHTEEIRKMILEARNTLAQKALENGKLYIKLSKPDAALIYFNYVIESYPETEYSSEAKFYAAEMYEETQEYSKALALYTELQNEELWKKKVLPRIKDLQPLLQDQPEPSGTNTEEQKKQM